MTRWTAVILALLFPLIGSAADIEPRTVVVTFRAGSDMARTWQGAGRIGPIDDLVEVIGSHTSRPYVGTSTLMSVERAYARRNDQRRIPTRERTIARIAVIRYEGDADPAVIARKLSTIPDVEHAEPLAVQRLVDVPNDPEVAKQTHLPIVEAFAAWEHLPSDRTVVIGIVDTGIDTTHPDLGAHVWRNPGETGRDGSGRDRRSNGVDDDGNGFVDDWFGWDFVGSNAAQEDNVPLPGNSHGTHVGGIAAAITNNNLGVAGVGQRLVVMPVKIGYDDVNSSTVARSADGILYAAANGASIVNCSFGSASPSFADVSVIEEATELGALVVAAAGNAGSSMAFYPASYPDVLSVAATRDDDRLAFFTNTHASVDVCAPGVAIYSTVPGGGYEYLDGTSMASPIVAAIAGMVRLVNPSFSPEATRAAVMATCDNIDSQNGVFLGQFGVGRVNARKAVTAGSARWANVLEPRFADTDADGFLEPMENVDVSFTLRNELGTLTDAVVKVTTAPAAFSPDLVRNEFRVGPMAAGEVRTLQDAFRIGLPVDMPYDGELRLMVNVYDGETFVGRQLLTATVNPTYRTITTNDIGTTVNSIGNIGFNDYPSNSQGIGLTYRGGPNLLFEGGLMIGVQPRDLPNVIRAGSGDRKDTSFHLASIAEIRSDSTTSGVRVSTGFSDVYDPWGIGVQVRQNVYAMTADSVRNTIIIALDITNRVDTTIRDLYVAEFFDVDLGPAGASNGCAWDDERGIGFVKNTRLNELPTVGMAMISPLPLNFFALDNDGDGFTSPNIYDDFLRAEKWSVMSGGIARTNSRITDVSAIIGAGPFSLAPGERRQVVFVLGAGTSYDHVAEGIEASRSAAAALGLNVAPYERAPGSDAILHLEGSPLCTPGSREFVFTLASPSFVQVELVDLFGSPVRTILNEQNVPAGTHSRTIDIPSAAQGGYFLVLRTVTTTASFGFGIVR
jgi:subtilisin family serine protease